MITKASSKGFTLVEMMVTVLILAILAAIAVPSYSSQVRKSRRTEARNSVLDAAAREERFYATNNKYSQTATDLGYAALPQPGQYYQLAIACTPDATCTGYSVTATPQGPQVKDTSCATFQVDQTGKQTASAAVAPGGNQTAPDTTTTCWN
jgi:type IV pilus assembly protein PilE